MRGVRSVMQAGRGQKVDASHVGPVGDAGGARGAPYGQGGSEPGPGPGPEKSQEGGFWVWNIASLSASMPDRLLAVGMSSTTKPAILRSRDCGLETGE